MINKVPDTTSNRFSWLLLLVIILWPPIGHSQSGQNLAVFIDAGDVDGLIAAIRNANAGTGPDLIFVRPGPNNELTFRFDQGFNGGTNALPIITSDIAIYPVDSRASRITFESAGEDFRLAQVTGDGRFELGAINGEGINIDEDGGVINASGMSTVIVRDTIFRNNFGAEGGVIYATDNARIIVREGEFEENRAANLGGAISITGNATGLIRDSTFSDNQAGVFGCDINVDSVSSGNFSNTLYMHNNTFAANCANVVVENPRGRIVALNNTFGGMGDAIDSTDTVVLFSNLFGIEASSKATPKATCNDFGSNAFESLGYNIDAGGSCSLDQATDLPNTDPMIETADSNGIIAPKPGSVVIDSGAVDMLSIDGVMVLPCGYKDARGLGRPQDGSGDGNSECDIGSYEVQGGADIGPAQSGAYFDASRNGEGVFVEMLPGNQAFVAMFTYAPTGNDLVWFVGIDDVVGNSVVIDEMLMTSGGEFGPGFVADDIVRTPVGGMSLVFPDCDATSSPGLLSFQAETESELGFEDLQAEAGRLSRVLNCTGAAPARSGRSGSFYDPARSGEGIFLQWLTDDRVVVIWYTYTPDGRQFWTISGDVTVDGNTITADMRYPASTTNFGSQFDATEIDLQSWGSITLDLQPGCDDIDFSYNSTVSGFGSGNYTYTRLTTLDGTTCDL